MPVIYFFRGCITLALMITSTVLWCSILFLVGVLRWLCPQRLSQFLTTFQFLTTLMSKIANCWIIANNLFLDVFQSSRIVLEIDATVTPDRWYLVVSNHQTWADILVLQRVFLHKIPMLKFFVKQQLIWVPVLGLAWWALDFPFMKRYTRAQLQARPELKGKDLETTRAACEVFKIAPVSVLNFLEGTRFTADKHLSQSSPYKHLLRPRSGGTALVLNVMGSQIDALVDVTITYPDGVPGFWAFLCGRCENINVHVRSREIPPGLCSGDYETDAQFKQRFQDWINQIWSDKDQLIEDRRADV